MRRNSLSMAARALAAAVVLTASGCDSSPVDPVAPGTFDLTLRGAESLDLTGTAVAEVDSNYNPLTQAYVVRRTVRLDGGAAGSARVTFDGPLRPGTFETTGSGGTRLSVTTAEGKSFRMFEGTFVIDSTAGGGLAGSFEARLRHGGNPLSGIPSEKATTSGRFHAAEGRVGEEPDPTLPGTPTPSGGSGIYSRTGSAPTLD